MTNTDRQKYWQSLLDEAEQTAHGIADDIRRIKETLAKEPDLLSGKPADYMSAALQDVVNVLIAASTYHVYRVQDMIWTAAGEKEGSKND